MTQFIAALNRIKTYWSIAAAAAAAILFAMWRQKAVQVDELKLDNQTKALGGQITELKQEASNAQKQSNSSVASYDDLLRADPDLRRRLGLHDPDGSGNTPPPSL